MRVIRPESRKRKEEKKTSFNSNLAKRLSGPRIYTQKKNEWTIRMNEVFKDITKGRLRIELKGTYVHAIIKVSMQLTSFERRT